MATKNSAIEVVEFRPVASDQGSSSANLVTVTVRGDRALLERLLQSSFIDAQELCDHEQANTSVKAGRDDCKAFRDFWRRTQAGRRKGLLASAAFLHNSGNKLFCRTDLERLLSFLPEKDRPPHSQRTLIHLASRGYLERRKRGVYSIRPKGLECIESLRKRSHRKRSKKARRVVQSPLKMPRLDGISPFLRSVPSSTLWLKTLLCAYFLRRYCGVGEFNRELLTACFKRVRGLRVPGSLPAVLSQVLFKQYGYISPCEGRGYYTITEETFADLKQRSYVLGAERKLDRIRSTVDEEAGNLSNQDQHRASA
jgi:hypothetical protein